MIKKRISIYGILLVLIMIAALASLNYGVVSISPGEVWQTFLGNGSVKQEFVLFDIRLPSIILAIMV